MLENKNLIKRIFDGISIKITFMYGQDGKEPIGSIDEDGNKADDECEQKSVDKLMMYYTSPPLVLLLNYYYGH